jgi:hypothetical protein
MRAVVVHVRTANAPRHDRDREVPRRDLPFAVKQDLISNAEEPAAELGTPSPTTRGHSRIVFAHSSLITIAMNHPR